MGQEKEQLQEMSFWGHLDVLRGVLFKAVILLVALTAVLFIFMPQIFDNFILAPTRANFITYQLFQKLSVDSVLPQQSAGSDFNIELINIKLASQFFIHISSSLWMAVVIAFPFIIYLIWSFISPGLYSHEKRGAKRGFLFGCTMFYLGAATGYLLVFPITLRFLASYQLSSLVPNVISLDSYMDNFIMICLMMGILFELPLLAWLFGKMGFITRNFFSKYRRHAIVVLLILAAIVTPTGDPFTLAIVFFPIYFLWELSSFIVPKAKKENN